MESTTESTPLELKADLIFPSEKPEITNSNVITNRLSSKDLLNQQFIKTAHDYSNGIIPHKCDYKHSKFYTDMKASQESAMKKLIATTVTALLFMTTEIVGGTYSNSLAVITDAAH